MYINKKEQEAISLAIDIMDKMIGDGYQGKDVDEASDVLIELQDKIRKNSLRKPKKRIKPIDWSD